jgi:hypothetical protein
MTKDRSHFDFRINAAVWGIALIVMLLIATIAPWTRNNSSGYAQPLGSGPMDTRSLWQSANYLLGSWSDNGMESLSARITAGGILVTVFFAILAAAQATKGAALCTGVAAVATLVPETLFWFSDHYASDPSVGLYTTVLLTISIAVWAFVLASAASYHHSWSPQD